MTLEELLQKLRDLEYSSVILGKTEYFPVINQKNFQDVEVLIRQYALDNHDAELGILEAKVYAYEKIIANSNFAPMIIKEDSEVERDSKTDIIDKIRAEIDVARYIDKDKKLCKNANASGLEVAMRIIDKYRQEE